MGTLIDQFCQVARAWSEESGRDGEYLVWRTFLCTGGIGEYERVGRVSCHDLPAEERRKLTFSQRRGRHTVEQMKHWLETLVCERRMKEDFLVAALIRDIADDLQEMCDRYELRVEQSRRTHEECRGTIDGSSGNGRLERAVDGAWGDGAGAVVTRTETEMGRVVAEAASEETFTVSAAEKARLADDAASWMALTAPIVRRDNLRCGEREWFARVAGVRRAE